LRSHAFDGQGLDGHAVARQRLRPEQRVGDGFFRGLEDGLEERRERLGRQDRASRRRGGAVRRAHGRGRREGNREVAAAVRERRSRPREAEDRAGGEALEIAGGQRRVGRHHDHARSVGRRVTRGNLQAQWRAAATARCAAGARAFGAPRREGMLPQRLANREPVEHQHAAIVALHQHADGVAT
jgi:hypothetical protein